MAEMSGNGSGRQLNVRHRGRIAQISIYFGKFVRMFVYQSDWKVLPMAALIAGLVGFALGRGFGVTMEGTLTSSFAIVCVCIWNGSFNSIQVICRDRNMIKREHRSGMHITSFIMANLMYQLILCILQTIVTLVVLYQVGMQFAGKGMFTPWMVVDAGITMLLVTYASDLLSLWISTLVHNTTTAMTIMPFILIFQLIFSGGMFSLPKIVEPVEVLTISNPGLKALASQTKINDLPYGAINSLMGMVDDIEVGGRVTFGQILDFLEDADNPTVAELRAIQIETRVTVREIGNDLLTEERFTDLRSETLIENVTVGEAIQALMQSDSMGEVLDTEVGGVSTLGEVVDYLAANETANSYNDEGIDIYMTVGDAIDLIGREETMAKVRAKASEAMYKPTYAYTSENILRNWLHLLLFVAVFSLLSVITLEFIDKDKR